MSETILVKVLFPPGSLKKATTIKIAGDATVRAAIDECATSGKLSQPENYYIYSTEGGTRWLDPNRLLTFYGIKDQVSTFLLYFLPFILLTYVPVTLFAFITLRIVHYYAEKQMANHTSEVYFQLSLICTITSDRYKGVPAQLYSVCVEEIPARCTSRSVCLVLREG